MPISPVTNPAVARPSPPSRPPDSAISRLACRPTIIAGMPRNSPHETSEMIPSTRLVVALPDDCGGWYGCCWYAGGPGGGW